MADIKSSLKRFTDEQKIEIIVECVNQLPSRSLLNLIQRLTLLVQTKKEQAAETPKQKKGDEADANN